MPIAVSNGMNTASIKAMAHGAAALCCAATAGASTLVATQGWLIGQARQRLATRPWRVLAASAPASASPMRLLVIGDSTGVGVGSATPAESLLGRLQRDIDGAEIVNLAQIGARVADVAEQIAPLDGERFDFALVLAGGNDVMRMTPLPQLADDARALLDALRPLAGGIVWMGCADVGAAPCLIAPFSWFFSRRSRLTTRCLADAARDAGVDFVDFVDHPIDADLRRRPRRYFAYDGVHPSGFAYGRCYDVLKARPGFAAFLRRARRACATA